nr:hypothetical protein [Tanacetum cinerariifolium]
MSTRSSARNLFPPLDNPELTIRRRSHVDPTLLNDFEMAAKENGDTPVLTSRLWRNYANKSKILANFMVFFVEHRDFFRDKMSRDVITVGSTMRISLLYRGGYSQWRERFMNYLEEKTDGEAMINSIQNGDQPLPVIAQVSLAGNALNAPHTLKDPKFWTAEEKKTRKIGRLARSLLIQRLPNDIYSLIDGNETAKDI